MNETDGRLTPHDIAQKLWDEHPVMMSKNPDPSYVIVSLEEAGYVIVHPDDFPHKETWHDQSAGNKGYNEALWDIFWAYTADG